MEIKNSNKTINPVYIEYSDFVSLLQGKDDDLAYQLTKRIIEESKDSDIYYKYFDDIAYLLDNNKSYIRTRAFMLCCALAKWDKESKIKEILPKMLRLYHDEKPTVVRQCLKASKQLVEYLPKTGNQIKEEISKIDLNKYKDSMVPLIQKDIDELIKYLTS